MIENIFIILFLNFTLHRMVTERAILLAQNSIAKPTEIPLEFLEISEENAIIAKFNNFHDSEK